VFLGIKDTFGIGRWHYFGNGYTADDISTDAVIIVYDITQQDSLRIARQCLDECRRKFTPNIFKALAGNKADLVSDRKVTFEVTCVCSHSFTSGVKSAVILSNPILSHRRDTSS